MKIAYIVPKLAQKGPVIVVRELVAQMMAHGHECTVFYLDEGPDELDFPCVTRRLTWLSLALDFGRFDIVHSHGLRPDLYVFLHKPLGRVKPARRHARCISTLHNYVFDDLRYQYNRLTALVAGRAWLAALRRHDAIVTLSRHALQYYSRYLPAQKLTYAYNTRRLPQDIAGFRPLTEAETAEATAFPPDMPTIAGTTPAEASNQPQAATPQADNPPTTTALQAPAQPQAAAPQADGPASAKTSVHPQTYLIGVHAQLTDRKGIDQLLRVLPQLPDYRLLVIGDGPTRAELERLSAEQGLAGRVRFLGYRPNASRYLPLYDLYALPSRSEGFPLALLEAAAHGSAVVCSDLPVFKELVSENEATFFALENPDSLRQAILDATAHKAELARNLHARYLSAFSPEHFYKRYLEIYENPATGSQNPATGSQNPAPDSQNPATGSQKNAHEAL